MEYIDQDILVRLIESGIIGLVAIALFFGLRGKILLFAQWAGMPRLALAPVRLLLRYLILIIAAALILGRWGFPIGTILAFLGTLLGLVAIGFVAVWSVLSNFLCTFVLVMFKPFSIGDELELPADNVRGRVVDLSLIFTTLQGADGVNILVPNNTYFQRIFKRRAGINTVGLGDQLRSDRSTGHPDTRCDTPTPTTS